MTIDVLQGGLQTTVQDGGRYGFRQDGVSVCGALDDFALRAANTLAGNSHDAAVLEITFAGCALRFTENRLIAICGGDLTPAINERDVPCWRPIFVKANAVLAFRHMRAGCRAYLAVSGGLDVSVLLGSRSTDLRAQFGGYAGRSLRAGDSLHCLPETKTGERLREKLTNSHRKICRPFAKWFVSANARPSFAVKPQLRVILGSEFEEFSEASRRALFECDFTITTEANRMAYRLRSSDTQLELTVARESHSTAVAPGAVQVPRDGNPILLLADCQTTGGYPVIAHVIRADLSLVAQMKPGDALRFVEVALDEAHGIHLEQERTLTLLRYAVDFKVSGQT